jgi:hypothetical protein
MEKLKTGLKCVNDNKKGPPNPPPAKKAACKYSATSPASTHL